MFQGLLLGVLSTLFCVEARITFEKLTNLDYPGNTYYTIRNLSLYECQGWCRDEVDCVAAVFKFVVNPMTPVQNTTCQLQNETKASQLVVVPQKSINTYHLTKIHVLSENVCNRLWAFEKIPKKALRGLDSIIVFTANKKECLAACLNENRFTCRSVEFNYMNLQCHLSEYDRRSPGVFIDMIDMEEVDYFENSCLQSNEICSSEERNYEYPTVPISLESLVHFVELNYYPDKELLVNNEEDCLRLCSIENEFICRSFLYRYDVHPRQPNCAFYHLDHMTFQDGAEAYSNPNPLPLLGISSTAGIYLEAVCGNGTTRPQTGSGSIEPKVPPGPLEDTKTTPSTLITAGNIEPGCDAYGFCYDVTLQCTDRYIKVFVNTNRPFHGRIYALGRSETCNSNVLNGQKFRLNVPLTGQDCNTESLGGVYTNTIVLQHHSVVMTKADKIYNVRCTYETNPKNVSFEMMSVRDPDTMQVTAAPPAPMPTVTILSSDGREATTVRIGDKLTFLIEIPDNTPYRIFARSCVAMAKDGSSTFQITDERGCPIDNTIFPRFVQRGSGLESMFDAFRFTESYGVIFQCNVKYCIGKCEPVVCGLGREAYESWGRRKRALPAKKYNDEMTLSHEILVLDYGDGSASTTTTTRKNDYQKFNKTYNIQESVSIRDDCVSKTSVMALSVISATLLVSYICTVAYFVVQKRTLKTFP
ncbi:uncharacterized protein LOC106459393 [Limulus polyphemus]|uniref:Uncharacterized protein LOC106459393 n=1 Tax=Limulus polyphemus TaxID=6850 RepID=A0ABM1B469_LIMPO|nr:uncharacterized protein LOC106459393 [Limulus polyphemus]